MALIRYLYFTKLILLLCFNNTYGQLSSSDSSFFTLNFTDVLYAAYPAHNTIFKNPEVTSKQNLYQQILSMCPFTESNYSGCYERLIVSSSFIYDTILNPDYNWYFNQNPNWGLGQLNPIVDIDYQLDGISRQVSALYTPSIGSNTTNCNTAFVIFPGSGPNTTSQVAHGSGYHGIYCHTKNLLKQKGDVFSYCKPNEDWRAVYWNKRKLTTEWNSAYLVNYLDGINQNLGINSTIEFIALLKFLKQKYSKVVVLALSHAGLNTVISLSEVDVDAYLISGGYTADTISFQNAIFAQQKYFGNLYNINFPSKVKNNIANAKSLFHFCWAQTDGAIEYVNKYTQNFFGPLPNLSFSYSHLAHSFPHCSTIDSFVQKVLSKPKSILKQTNTCTTDSINLMITFCGQAPFSFHIKKDGNSLGNFISNTDTFFISFTQEGKYVIDSLVDATNILGFRSDTFKYIKTTPVQLSISQQYSCDSNYSNLQVNLEGKAPFQLNYILNSTGNNTIIYDTTTSFKLYNDTLSIISVTDHNNCFLDSITPVITKNDPANVSISSSNYSCTSNLTDLKLILSGKAPWSLNYLSNGVFHNFTTNNDTSILSLTNGIVNLLTITDSNNCTKAIYQTLTINNEPLNYTITPPAYNCDSNKSLFSLSITGNPPYTIYYRKNGVPTTLTTSSSNHNLWVTNGNYIFDSIKDATCKRIINSSYSINYSPITFTLGPSSTNCDSNKINIPILVSGNPPYTLRYQKDGIALTTTLNGNTNLLLANGTYLFQELEDAQGCIKQINQVRNLNHQVLGITLTPPAYNCDSNKTLISLTLTGNPPYTIYYRKNGAPTTLTTSSSNHNLWVTNGNYIFDSIKDATCKRIINSSYSINYSPITITLGPSSTNCDSNKINIPILVSGNPPYTLRYQKDGIAHTTTLSGNTNLLLANGTYLFEELEDAQGCIKQINQVRNLNHQVLGITITPPAYNCDSNKSLFGLSITGNPPYTIYYRKNVVPTTLTTSFSNHNLWETNGNYVFDSIKDATCKKVIPSNNYFINTNPVNITISNPVYICDSNKTRLSFSCQGTPPFNLYYQMNGNSLSHATASSSFDLHFSNGNLLIEKIIDANGCEKFINNNYNFSETPVSAVLSNPTYNCDSSLHVINVQCTGKAPWNILYSNGISTYTYTTGLNSSTLKLTNGNYNIQTVQDANGCAKQINQSFALNVNPTLISALNAGYDCDSNKLKLIVNLTNHGPWILQFQKIAPNNQSFSVIATNSSNTYFFEPGSYVLSSVKNQIGCTTFAGYNFSNNFTPLSITQLGSSIDCDSAKLKTTYQLNGDGPWNLIYQDLNSGLYSSINTSTPLLNLYTPTGGIKLSVLSDSKCSIPLSDTVLNNYIPLSSQFLNQSPACDSGKTKLSFLTNGGMMPYNYSYSFNGTNLTLPSSSDSLHLLLPKGSLYMSSVSDTLGCSYTINKQFTLDYSPFRYDSLSSYYNCSSDSSFIKYFCETSSPLTVNYTPKNGTTQQFTFLNENEQFVTNNTYYVHNIVDTFGCAVMVNDTVSLNNYPIQEQNVVKISNCINQDYKFVFQLTGTSPWQLNYIQDNTAQQMLISQSPAVIPASVGDYFFISVIDSNQCQDTIHQYHQLLPYLDTAFSITYSRATLSVSMPAVKYFWYKDSQVFDTTSVPKTAFIGNGSYFVSIIDSLGCEYTSQILNIENIEPILVYPNPSDGVYTITLNYKLTEPWSYTLFDMYGRKIKTETQIDNHHRLDIRTLANGKYLLYLKYNEDGFYTNKVIAIEKR